MSMMTLVKMKQIFKAALIGKPQISTAEEILNANNQTNITTNEIEEL